MRFLLLPVFPFLREGTEYSRAPTGGKEAQEKPPPTEYLPGVAELCLGVSLFPAGVGNKSNRFNPPTSLALL